MHKPRGAYAVLDAIALVLLALETLAVAVIAVGYAVYALLERDFSGLGWSLAAVAAIMAAGLGIFTWGFAGNKRFALGGVVTWQLMQASVGVWLLGSIPAVGLMLVVAAALAAWSAVRRQVARGRAPLSSDAEGPAA